MPVLFFGALTPTDPGILLMSGKHPPTWWLMPQTPTPQFVHPTLNHTHLHPPSSIVHYEVHLLRRANLWLMVPLTHRETLFNIRADFFKEKFNIKITLQQNLQTWLQLEKNIFAGIAQLNQAQYICHLFATNIVRLQPFSPPGAGDGILGPEHVRQAFYFELYPQPLT